MAKTTRVFGYVRLEFCPHNDHRTQSGAQVEQGFKPEQALRPHKQHTFERPEHALKYRSNQRAL